MATSQTDTRFYLTKASNKFNLTKASTKLNLTMVKPAVPPGNRITALPDGEFITDSDGNFITHI